MKTKTHSHQGQHKDQFSKRSHYTRMEKKIITSNENMNMCHTHIIKTIGYCL